MNYTRSSLIELTKSGLDIYSHVISQYQNGSNNLEILETNGNMTYPNPFNGMRQTLQITVADNGIAYHSDTTGAIAKGDAIDFASLHYKLGEEELLHVLYNEMGLGSENVLVSLFEAPITNVVPSMSVEIMDVFDLIKGDSYKDLTLRLRALDNAKDARSYKSQHFDYVTFSGEFTTRSDKGLLTHSGLLVIDFDDLPNLEDVREDLLGDDSIQTALLFTSPSGKGLKWIVYIDLDICSHKEWFHAISDYVQQVYGLEVDQSGKDISRACFLSYDEMAFYQPRDRSKMKFDPIHWLSSKGSNKESSFQLPLISPTTKSLSKMEEVEALVSKVEEQQIDLTTSYDDWVKIGFALSDEFGENGRSLFHRLSAFYNGYTKAECDRQYDNCLRSAKYGVTISSLFYLAKNAGIALQADDHQEISPMDGLPKIPHETFEKLPDFFQSVTEIAKNEQERDLLLLGSLIVISACLTNVEGKYDRRTFHPNLYLFVVGKASAGKGILNHCKHIVTPIHKELREQSEQSLQQYDSEMLDYNRRKKGERGKPPKRPSERRLYIPANTSSSGAYQLIDENQGVGLIFETEGDTLSQAFKADYGNYSDGLRKAYQHETISYYRKTERESIEIDKPCISALLSGTPKQVSNLIDSPENGLFSRFMFYYIEPNTEWNDVFAEPKGMDTLEQFQSLGVLFHEYHTQLTQRGELSFSLQKHQEEAFNEFFSNEQFKYLDLLGEDFLASVRRLGLMAFRIAMILTVIRSAEKNDSQSNLSCHDNDFNAAMGIVDVLFKHASYVFTEMFDKNLLTLKIRFLKSLPEKFNRGMYLEVAARLGIKEKTAESYINGFIKGGSINRYAHNQYVKL